MKAIRINNCEVLNSKKGEWHYDILRRYQARENLTFDQLYMMINAGKIEFGDSHWTINGMRFAPDGTRTELYKSIDAIEGNLW